MPNLRFNFRISHGHRGYFLAMAFLWLLLAVIQVLCVPGIQPLRGFTRSTCELVMYGSACVSMASSLSALFCFFLAESTPRSLR